MADMKLLLQQAQRMQEQLQKAQAEIAKQTITAEAGAGLVKVTMNGRHEVQKVEFDPALLQEEQGIIEDLVAAAVNAAVKKVEELNRSSMGAMASGLNLPEGFKLPF
jgi:DNA-binding YbaB/EbfC family protein